MYELIGKSLKIYVFMYPRTKYDVLTLPKKSIELCLMLTKWKADIGVMQKGFVDIISVQCTNLN